DGKSNRRIRNVEDRIHALVVEPSAGDGRSDIRLASKICGDNLDLESGVGIFLEEILACHLRGDHQSAARSGGISRREIAEHAQLDRAGHPLTEGRLPYQ